MRHRTRPARPTSSTNNKGANPDEHQEIYPALCPTSVRRLHAVPLIYGLYMSYGGDGLLSALVGDVATVQPAIVPRWSDDGALHFSPMLCRPQKPGASGPLLRIWRLEGERISGSSSPLGNEMREKSAMPASPSERL